jgi:uncharacterized protein YdhG (YjbR/CyaY superfamily)
MSKPLTKAFSSEVDTCSRQENATKKKSPVSVYIAAQPEVVRPALERLRVLIRKALPDAEEVISYQIPAYRLPGGMVIFFAGWKAHVSLYPATGRVATELADAIAPYKVSKGTLRFALDKPIPARLVTRIVKLRAEEVRAAAVAKATKRRR